MIKDLTKSTGNKSSNKSYTNHQLNLFLNQKVEEMHQKRSQNRNPIHQQEYVKEITPKNKDTSSYFNEKTADTTMGKNANPKGKIQNHLYNFLKDSTDLKVSGDMSQNLNKSVNKSMNKSVNKSVNKLSRPQSTKMIQYGVKYNPPSSAIKKPRSDSAGASSILKGKKLIDQNRSQEMIRSTNKSFEDNVKTLEMYINEIKMRGFEKVRNEVDQKQRVIKHLQLEVDSLQKKVNFVNSQKKHFGTKNSKFQSEMYMYKEISERCNRDIYFMYKEMPTIKKDIEEMNVEYGNRIRETKMIYTLIAEEDRNINFLKEEIRKLNKRNSDIEKEKESYRNGIALLKKHIQVVKDKIKTNEEKCKEFMTNVSTFVNKSLCE